MDTDHGHDDQTVQVAKVVSRALSSSTWSPNSESGTIFTLHFQKSCFHTGHSDPSCSPSMEKHTQIVENRKRSDAPTVRYISGGTTDVKTM